MLKNYARSCRANPRRILLTVAALLLIVWQAEALAAAAETVGFLPFTKALDALFEELIGPVARGLLFVMIAFGLLMWAGSNQGSGLQFVGKAIVVLAIIGGIPTILAALGISASTL